MKAEKQSAGALGSKIAALLESDDFQGVLPALDKLQVRQTLRPLLALLCVSEVEIRRRAGVALGIQVAKLAAEDMEAARHVVRRLMWSLNDESGSIGWGAPEALVDILVNHEGLAEEYAHILTSYMEGGGNELEHNLLQCSLLQGLARLGRSRRELLRERGACNPLPAYLASADATIRGLAAWCAGILGADEAGEGLLHLLDDPVELTLYRDGGRMRCRVGELAREALAALDTRREK